MRMIALLLFGLVLPVLGTAVAADLDISVRFSSDEISIIREFYRHDDANNGGGKKGAKPLPPGIAKNFARGKPLPPGIAKRSLPDSLIKRLPPVPDGYERIIVAGKILLVEIATQVVHDILVDVILD